MNRRIPARNRGLLTTTTFIPSHHPYPDLSWIPRQGAQHHQEHRRQDQDQLERAEPERSPRQRRRRPPIKAGAAPGVWVFCSSPYELPLSAYYRLCGKEKRVRGSFSLLSTPRVENSVETVESGNRLSKKYRRYNLCPRGKDNREIVAGKDDRLCPLPQRITTV